ncbi:hypothetical protein BH09BAC4_BH09BAC4_36470 [soil metagenome]
MAKTYSLTLFADYFQLFIHDASLNWAEVEIDSNWWTEEDHKRLVSSKEADRLLVMGTFRNFIVPLEVVVFEAKPLAQPLIDWDQVVECSLQTESLCIRIGELANEEDNGLLIEGSQPHWRVRLYYGGEDTIDKMGIEGQDHYRIELWPTYSVQTIETIKQRVTC